MSQETSCRTETVIVDNGSTDQTLETARHFNPVVAHLPREQWNPGRATNLGVQRAAGDYVVTLSSDAIPADGSWLQALVDHFDDPAVAAACSRQIAPPGASPLAEVRLAAMQGPYRTVYDNASLKPADTPSLVERSIVFSHASSCARRELLLAHPVPEYTANEDKEWAKGMLSLGHRLVYEPRSLVLHAEDTTLAGSWDLFRRKGLTQAATGRPMRWHQWPGIVLLETMRDLSHFEKMGMGSRSKFWWGIRSAVYWSTCTFSQIRASRWRQPAVEERT